MYGVNSTNASSHAYPTRTQSPDAEGSNAPMLAHTVTARVSPGPQGAHQYGSYGNSSHHLTNTAQYNPGFSQPPAVYGSPVPTSHPSLYLPPGQEVERAFTAVQSAYTGNHFPANYSPDRPPPIPPRPTQSVIQTTPQEQTTAQLNALKKKVHHQLAGDHKLADKVERLQEKYKALAKASTGPASMARVHIGFSTDGTTIVERSLSEVANQYAEAAHEELQNTLSDHVTEHLRSSNIPMRKSEKQALVASLTKEYGADIKTLNDDILVHLAGPQHLDRSAQQTPSAPRLASAPEHFNDNQRAVFQYLADDRVLDQDVQTQIDKIKTEALNALGGPGRTQAVIGFGGSATGSAKPSLKEVTEKYSEIIYEKLQDVLKKRVLKHIGSSQITMNKWERQDVIRSLANEYGADLPSLTDNILIHLKQPKAPPGRSAAIAPSAPSTGAAQRNLALATNALKLVRSTIYNKQSGSFKSPNKFSLMKDRAQESVRQQNASQHSNTIRGSFFQDAVAYSQAVWNSKGHDREQLSFAARDCISRENPLVPLARLGFTSHTATLVGELPAGLNTRDMRQWPSHLVICDPWLNVACAAKDYPDQFTAKMQKWSNAQKRIEIPVQRLSNDQQHIEVRNEWIHPQDPSWLGMLQGDKTLAVRTRDNNGQVKYVVLSPDTRNG